MAQKKQGSSTPDGIDSEILAFILNDYHKHMDLEQVVVDRSDNYLERYITVITGVVGIFLAVSELSKPHTISWQVVCVITGIPLLIGIAYFIRLVTYDFYFRQLQKHKMNIMSRLSDKYPNLPEYYPIQDKAVAIKYREWESVRSIFRRAISYAGVKTIITIGNSAIVAVISFILMRNLLSQAGLITSLVLSLLVFLLVAFIHIGYARVSYKLKERYFN